MADLNNSARKLLRATYTPIHRKRDLPRLKQAWAKFSFINEMQVTHKELDAIRKLSDANVSAVDAIESVINQKVAAAGMENVPLFADIKWDSLISITEHLAKLREDDLEVIRATDSAIWDAYAKEEGATSLQSQTAQAQEETTALVDVIRKQQTNILSAPDMSLKNLLEWAVKNNVRAKESGKLLNLLSQLSKAPEYLKREDLETWGMERVRQAHNQVFAMKQSATTEPVGLLHLERLNFVPAGIERGELIHSVPLSPGEEVNISHKEWSNTSEEFSRIVTDFMEAYSEEGVTEKNELTQSTNSQEQHSSGFNTGVSASGGYGPVSITTSLGTSVTDAASHSEQSARTHSMETTRKASARSKSEHKISFKVASASGTQDQEVRKIKNPFPDKATRVDYYQLVRKWRVDLFRYGLRLTYDIMIPEPGGGILSKIKEIELLTDALEIGFDDPKAPKNSPAYFEVDPTDITRDNYISFAAMYNATVPSPPNEFKWYDVAATHHWSSFDESKIGSYYTLEIEVEDEYKVDESKSNPGKPAVSVNTNHHSWTDEDPPVFSLQSTDDFLGKSGKLILVYFASKMPSLYVELRVRAKLRESALEDWQLKVWNAIRDAAQARYEQYRQALKDRIGRLRDEVGAQDPLSLRKIEREEVMKGVLRWLFGPGFDFTTGFKAYLFSDVATFSNDPWAQALAGGAMSLVRAHAETIKFLHHAIEWENMLYFLYPYFWSHPGSNNERWEFKKFLNHPELMHRSFLKSGSARVVLTIRPGFEKDFVTFLETGKFDPLSEEHPYFAITNEMEAYAKTNYPGIRPANPVEDARPLLTPKQRKAWKEMQQIMAALDEYQDNNGAYPTTDAGLAVLSNVPLNDPWDNAYAYVSPGLVNDGYDLASYGADAVPNGEDEAADITSWAEANLIGRWYEYTPTSALDIAFDETKPEA